MLLRLYQGYFQLYFSLAPKRAAHRAYTVFAKPRMPKLKAQEAAVLAQAQQEKVQFEQLQIQTYHWKPQAQQANGKRIMLVHGWAGNAGHWGGVVSHLLAQGYELFAYDQPAHNQSQGQYTNMLEASRLVAQQLKAWQPDFLIGHSFGSGASALALHDHPEAGKSLQGLILLSSPDRIEDVFADFGKLMRLKPKQMQGLVRYVESRFKRQMAQLNVSDCLTQVKLPTLLVHDQLDRVLPYRFAQQIMAKNPQIELQSPEKLGHYKMLWSDYVFHSVSNFLDQYVSATSH